VIEGEGLGGFARRVTVNESAEGLFRPRRCFFAIDEVFANKIASGTKYCAQIQNRHDARLGFLTKEEGMSDDRTKADKAWEARQEAARYRIFNAATNAAEATDEADDENYFAVLDQAGNAAETAAAEITGYKTYADLLEALDTRRKQS
jgi:hypothetical protein